MEKFFGCITHKCITVFALLDAYPLIDAHPHFSKVEINFKSVFWLVQGQNGNIKASVIIVLVNSNHDN